MSVGGWQGDTYSGTPISEVLRVSDDTALPQACQIIIDAELDNGSFGLYTIGDSSFIIQDGEICPQLKLSELSLYFSTSVSDDEWASGKFYGITFIPVELPEEEVLALLMRQRERQKE